METVLWNTRCNLETVGVCRIVADIKFSTFYAMCIGSMWCSLWCKPLCQTRSRACDKFRTVFFILKCLTDKFYKSIDLFGCGVLMPKTEKRIWDQIPFLVEVVGCCINIWVDIMMALQLACRVFES